MRTDEEIKEVWKTEKYNKLNVDEKLRLCDIIDEFDDDDSKC